MNITFISFWSCPLTRLGVLSSGGMNVYVLNLANNLALLGYKVDIYTKTHRENDETVLKIHKNVRVIHLFVKKTNEYRQIEPFSDKILFFMRRNAISYDVVHSHYYYSGLVGLVLREKLSLPLFMTFHALGIMKDVYGGIKDKKRVLSEKMLAGQADSIISSVELEKEELSKRYQADKKKIFTVPPGVNHRIFKKIKKTLARKKLALKGKEKTILFVGRIDPIKGITLLINAVSLLAKKYEGFKNNFRVILIGGDIKSSKFWRHPEVIKIQTLIEKLDLSCCIKFIGAKPHNLLSYYYNISDLVVAPSRFESFGLVVLEAMACGATVVASQIGGLSYLIKDKINGRFFKNGDTAGLARVMWELLNDRKQSERLGRQAALDSQKYCWDKQAYKVAQIYSGWQRR